MYSEGLQCVPGGRAESIVGGDRDDYRSVVAQMGLGRHGHRAIGSIRDAEPIGPKKLLDALVIAPCTGNTLGKLAAGIWIVLTKGYKKIISSYQQLPDVPGGRAESIVGGDRDDT